ncbi:hypothetical protein, partial [Providencia alcalifaciens]|uniref:hypothetical protein n=1 Tax=Providencia alcalifaciens TaxID=126385 RepID=UPI002B0624C8
MANISVRKQEIIDKTPEKYKQRVIKLLDKIEEKMVNHIAKQKKKSIDLVKDFGYEQQRVSELDVNMFSSHRNSELSDEISWKNNRLGFMPESVFYDGEIKIARDSSIGVDTRLMIAQLIYDFNESNSVQTETIKSVIRA